MEGGELFDRIQKKGHFTEQGTLVLCEGGGGGEGEGHVPNTSLLCHLVMPN